MHRLHAVKGLVIPLVCFPFLCLRASIAQETIPPEDSTLQVYQRPQAGEISIEAIVDSPRVPSNETLTLTIQASCIGDIHQYEFQWPGPPDLERLEIVGSSSGNIAREDTGGQLVHCKAYRYILKPVGEGRGRIGPVVLNYTDKLTQREYSLSTRAIGVEITEPAIGSAGGFSNTKRLLVVLLAAAAVAGIVFVVLRRRTREVDLEPPVDTKEPEEIALEGLEGLPELRLAGETKEYYSTISGILRDYIDRKFALRTLELTTPDIVHHLRSEEVEEETIVAMEKMFTICDMVKFARHEPPPSDLDAINAMVRDFFMKRMQDSLETGNEGGEQEGAS